MAGGSSATTMSCNSFILGNITSMPGRTMSVSLFSDSRTEDKSSAFHRVDMHT